MLPTTSERLVMFRKRQGLNAAELADKLCICRQTLSAIECGKTPSRRLRLVIEQFTNGEIKSTEWLITEGEQNA
jgi:transcriptional regulator with XRE-family HTH domain